MKNSFKFLIVLSLNVCLGNSIVLADESTTAGAGTRSTMTASEYEAYRERLQNQIRTANPPASPGQSTPSAETEAHTNANESGYGQGYRARTERNESAGRSQGSRSQSMGRAGAGGRNR